MRSNFSFSDLFQTGSAVAVPEMPVSPTLMQRGKMRSTWGFDPKSDTVFSSSPALGGAQGRSAGRSLAACAFPSAGKVRAFPCYFWPELIIIEQQLLLLFLFFSLNISEVFSSWKQNEKKFSFFFLTTQIPSSHGEWDLQVLWGDSRGRKKPHIFLTCFFFPSCPISPARAGSHEMMESYYLQPTTPLRFIPVQLPQEFQPPF